MGWGPEVLSSRLWDLSAGERRLVQVLAATLAPAGFIALDEPTCGLDPDRRSDLARWVGRTAETTPVLVASQDLEWVSSLGATRVVIRGYLP
jgi:ABC-type multidrug transport system ATPase subunit